MIRKLIDALTGYEAFMPTMALLFGFGLLLSDGANATRYGAIGWAALTINTFLFLLVVAGVWNDRIEYRKWSEALERNEQEQEQTK